MSRYLKIFLFLALPLYLNACLWLEGTTIDGSYIQTEERVSSIFLKQSLSKTPKDRFEIDKNSSSIEAKAIKDIINKNYKGAIDKFLKIEKVTPNRYETASNLGTVYELNGNLKEALFWIKEGIKRNPEFHYKTEWLHALILKTEIKLQNNHHYLDKNFIIKLPNKFTEYTRVEVDNQTYTIKEIKDALFYQLRERMIFIKPKDKVVANLLYTLAKIEEQTTVLQEAQSLLELAKEYGFNNNYAIMLIENNMAKAQALFQIKIIFTIVIVIIALTFLYRLSKKRLKEIQKSKMNSFTFAVNMNAYMLGWFFLGVLIVVALASIIGIKDITKGELIYIKYLFFLLSMLSIVIGLKLSLRNLKARKIVPKNLKNSIYLTLILYFITVVAISYFNIEYATYSLSYLILLIPIYFIVKNYKYYSLK